MDFSNLEEHMKGTRDQLLAAKTTYVISEGKYDSIIQHLRSPTSPVSAHFRAWVKKKMFLLQNIPELGVVNSLVVPADEKNRQFGFHWRIVVHAEKMFQVVKDIHCQGTQHAGYKKTLDQIQRLFYGIPRSYVQEFTKNCPVCQLSASQTAKSPLRPLISKGFLHRVQIDLIDMRHDPDGEYKWIGHFMDYFSTYHVIFPLRSKTVQEVAEMLLQRVLSYLGVPMVFHSNNGREFVSQLLEALLDQWGRDATFIRGRPRHSQSQVMTENGNKSLQKRLVAMKASHGINNETPWASWLPRIQYEMNTTVQETLEQTPYAIVFGQPPQSQSSFGPGGSSVPVVDEEDMDYDVTQEERPTSSGIIPSSPEPAPRPGQSTKPPPKTTQSDEPAPRAAKCAKRSAKTTRLPEPAPRTNQPQEPACQT